MFTRSPHGYQESYPYFYDPESVMHSSDADWFDSIDESRRESQVRFERAGQKLKVDRLLVPAMRRYGIPDNGNVLSIGCGMGFDVLRLKEIGYKAIGTDLGGRARFWKEIGLTGDDLFLADARDLPIKPESFHVAYLWHVIEHFGTIDGNQNVATSKHATRMSIIEQIRTILKPGGILVIGTPNRLFPLDQYHGAHSCLPKRLYEFGQRRGIGIQFPFSRKNFLLSRRELVQLLKRYSAVEWLPAGIGLSLEEGEFLKSSSLRSMSKFITSYIKIIDSIGFGASPLSPALHVIARK